MYYLSYRERWRDFPFTGSLSKWLRCPGLGHTGARSLEIVSCLSRVCMGPSTCTIVCCFPGPISRKLDQNGAAGT